ncbi:SDA1-domain-containing protein [Gorgonomyces haynaldii]|nr:SDA1-domain-containing protein [Gorgonomyces haynaldii]
MVKRNRAEFLSNNLPQLQNMIKRDPMSYKQEFLIQKRHFESQVSIFHMKPDDDYPEFEDLIMFMSQVSMCYPQDCLELPQKIVDLLENYYMQMKPNLRKQMVQALILMRNRNMIQQTSLLSLFFTLFRCQDKQLRELLHSHIVSDIRNSNQKAKNNKLNKTLQNFMYTMLKDPNETAAKKSLEVMIELYKKRVWDDQKTVNVIAEACFLDAPKIVAPALHFFLGNNLDDDSDSDSDLDLDAMRHANQVNKKKKSRQNQLDRAMAAAKKKQRQRDRAETFNFSALHLVNDPQGYTEHLLSRLRQVTQKNIFKFELRMVMMNVISRMIGVHKLILLGFYDFMIPYLKPHQRDVTLMLAYLAQASHELVPPDVLETVVRAIADNFVWSNCASEVITAGLNGLREICQRAPLAMPQELLQSLLEDYKNHREKGPMTAARSLLSLYREFNPELLRKKDRGKAATMALKTFEAQKYAHVKAAEDIEGAEFLASDQESEQDSDDDEGDEDEWESVEGSGGSDDGFIDVGSGSEIEIATDSEDEQEDEQEEEEEEEVESPKKPKLALAAQKIFTDEDFARIRERKLEKEAERMSGQKIKQDDSDSDSEFVNVSKIMASIKRKQDKEARVESIKQGREGRKFGSKKGKERTSTTNREKAKKNKAFMMIVHKRSVKGKAKQSLREKQKALRKHIIKQKKQL